MGVSVFLTRYIVSFAFCPEMAKNLFSLCLVILLFSCQVSTEIANAACQPSLSIFSAEFDQSNVLCVMPQYVQKGQCICTFRLLELSACVYTNTRDSRLVNLVVNSIIPSIPETKYSSKCRRIIQDQGSCILGGISDRGFGVSIVNVCFGTASLICQISCVYRLVCSIIMSTFVKIPPFE